MALASPAERAAYNAALFKLVALLSPLDCDGQQGADHADEMGKVMSATMELYERIVEGECPMGLLRDACLEQEVDFLEAKALLAGSDLDGLKDLLGMI